MLAFSVSNVILLLSAAAVAQVGSNPPNPTAGVRVAFEVASIRPAVRSPRDSAQRDGGGGNGGRCPTSLRVSRSRVDVQCATVTMLIGYAFRLSPDRIAGPDWMTSSGAPRFDIAATIPLSASEHQVPEMFQALLVDRFKLDFHRANKNGEVYALVVERGGLKLKAAQEADGPTPALAPETGAQSSTDEFFGEVQTRTIKNADGRTFTTVISSPRMGTVRQTGEPFQIQRWQATSMSLQGLADLLDNVAPLSSPVVDFTGLKGRYEMLLEVSLSDARPGMVTVGTNPAGGGGPVNEMETAVLRGFNDGLHKLGLKLEHRKGTVEAVIVDHIEKTPTPN